ncbi:2-methylcitrate dehydratase PrpD [Sporomusaceae bacterium BoRhaA]|uniref:MmgE/PrpD family protein n=1 Tax=Pelorhabdus rhamnosifermentans TaxID=2772457 RepID=UPI001C0603BB|nr:MmgE/PrpD family protein [Pelorhabdus rhamnosifermentans]MBU2699630.1 2-methylcitrate dehydratase PrpD [Pelorhabdus rhamnosifermentans]
MGLVRLLADSVVETEFDKLSPEVVEQAKKCLLDCMGNMLGGRYTEKGRKIVQYASRWNNSPEATVIGYGKVSRETAAFANSVMSRAMDLDDGNRFSFGHPGSVLVPAALAMGEITEASGRDIINALVVGYDVFVRLGTTVNPSSYHERGFDVTGISGAVAVAAVAAKLYGLNAEQTKDALGIACLHAGGIIEYQNDGSDGKVLCPGWSTSTGIKAADLAQMGFTGPESILEGNKGFFQAFSNQYDINRLTDGLGINRGIMQTYFKMHACMRGLHCAIDALLSLRSEYALNPAIVKKITIRNSTFVNRLNKSHPKTIVGAQCSLPFAMAVALKYGCVDEVVLEKSIDDSEISKVEDRIEMIVDQKIQEYVVENPDNWTAVNVEVLTEDGKKVSQWAPVALGEPEKPLSWQQLQKKFTQMVADTAFEPTREAFIHVIQHFEECQSMNEFTELLYS